MRTVFAIVSFLSLLALVLLVVLWVDGRRGAKPRAVPLRWDGVRWQLWSRDGRLVLDNTPQKAIEDAEEARLERDVAARRAEEVSAMEGWKRVEWPAAGRPDAERAAAVAEYRRAEAQAERAADAHHAAVFALVRMTGSRRVTNPTRYSTPIALPVVLAGVLPVGWGLLATRSLRERRRRSAQGMCFRCAYDLRGGPDAGRCPECGAERQTQPQSARSVSRWS